MTLLKAIPREYHLAARPATDRDNFAPVAIGKTKLVLTWGKYAVGVITEPAKRFSPLQPSEEWELVAKGIGHWMCCNQTCTLGEVPTILDRVSGRRTVDVREFS